MSIDAHLDRTVHGAGHTYVTQRHRSHVTTFINDVVEGIASRHARFLQYMSVAGSV